MTRYLILAGAIVLSAAAATERTAAQDAAPTVDQYVAWLSDPSRQWLASAHLQQMPQLATSRLLEPGRLTAAPHGEISAAGLTLAKIGEPAVPAIADRLHLVLREQQGTNGADVVGLLDVLREIGPPAVASLVAAAEWGPPWAPLALDAIARMEPRSRVYGQTLSPWSLWRVADHRGAALERAIVPLLPRIEKLMNRAATDPDQSAAHVLRPAAYLLARWGSPPQSAFALQLLEDLARSASFHASLEVIRMMHALKAPETAAALEVASRRVPAGDELHGSYLLSMGIALFQLGEGDYGGVIEEAIRTGRPADRLDAAWFLGQTENLADVPRLVALLSDETRWNGRSVAQAALEGLRLLTLEDLAPEPDVWRAWYASRRDRSRRAVVEQWVGARRRQLDRVPIWEANAWIEQLAGTRDASVLPFIADYLRRKDLRASATGPSSTSGGSGLAPGGKRAPAVVTLLFAMTQASVPGALAGLDWCLDAQDAEVRMFGAVALASYEPQRAADALARELSDEPVHRHTAAELLLHLGDARGILARVDALEFGARIYGDTVRSRQDEELSRGIRMFACRDLRMFSQQPLPCDPTAREVSLATQVSAWRAWASAAAGRRLRLREAQLDLDAVYRVRAVTIGKHVAY